jgi:hypothetical protein
LRTILRNILREQGKDMLDNLTWECHICKEERPDDKVSVITKPLMMNGLRVGDQNIRYCNDNESCIERSKTFSFIKEDKVKNE